MEKRVSTIAGLPVYRAELTEDTDGMFCVSLVDYPAVERDFEAFSAIQKVDAKFSITDESKRLLHGVIMRANYPIYREDHGFKYFIVFTPQMIAQMAEKYLTDGFANSVNMQHDGIPVDGVSLVQWYIKDSARGINPKGFEDVEDGSLFGEFKVHNDDVWERVKSGELRGFSIEIVYEAIPSTGIHSTEKIEDVISWITTKLKSNMNLKARLRRLLASFGAVTTDKGVLHWEGDEELAVGMEVFVEGEDGENAPAADGEYVLENGTIVVVADGEVAEIREPEEEAPAAEEETPAEETEAADETEVAEEETPAVEEVAEEVEQVAEEVSDNDDRIAALEARVAELEEILNALMGGMEAKSLHKRFKADTKQDEQEKSPFERAKEVRKALRSK